MANATGAAEMDVNSIHYPGGGNGFPLSRLALVAKELYDSPSVDGLCGAINGLQVAFTSYGGDPEFAYTLFAVIEAECKRILAFVQPHTADYDHLLDERYSPHGA